MAVSEDFLEFVLEQLAPAGQLKPKRMFGGVGLYASGLFFAILDDDTLYLKGDAALKPAFEAAGSHPFDPFGEGKPMAYWSAPAEAMDDPELLVEWARRSMAVAARKKR
ncbi:competence protein TfoX [Caulobacter flavus]|uniref:Competence protein TfoX n=1 Tax=Caulobacter flavus TaxID=1679497 RepID=A0A2N5CRV3_9CAUL|nr:TfoX/Sxy family protein [Caulobacter flavus]AYV46411.1 competence protein TfoX [Caulobacter flavus]PLR12708.1 competence protein TfoX [Caulobacter flavus]